MPDSDSSWEAPGAAVSAGAGAEEAAGAGAGADVDADDGAGALLAPVVKVLLLLAAKPLLPRPLPGAAGCAKLNPAVADAAADWKSEPDAGVAPDSEIPAKGLNAPPEEPLPLANVPKAGPEVEAAAAPNVVPLGEPESSEMPAKGLVSGGPWAATAAGREATPRRSVSPSAGPSAGRFSDIMAVAGSRC